MHDSISGERQAARRFVQARADSLPGSYAAMDELAIACARALSAAQPRCDETLNQLPLLGSVLSTDLLPIFHNGVTYGVQADVLSSVSPVVPMLFNVRAYGAKGDGVTDDSAAIMAADNAAAAVHGCVGFPAGDYLASGLTKASVTKWLGVNAQPLAGSRIITTTNAALLTITVGCAIENIAFIGPLTASFTACDLVTVDNCNGASFTNCSWYGGYNNLTYVDGSFYNTIHMCYMAEAINRGLYTYTTSPIGIDAYPAGVDINISDTQFIVGYTANDSSMFFDNVGTITMSNVAVNNAGCTRGVIWFNSAAKSYGGVFIDGSCQIESDGAGVGPALHFEGTAARPFNAISASGYMGGGNNALHAALELNFVNHSTFTGVVFAGSQAAIQFQGVVEQVVFVNPTILNLNSTIVAATGATLANIGIINPAYNGAQAFLYIGNVPGAQIIGDIDIIGGSIGTNALPISANLPTAPTRIRVDVSGYGVGQFAVAVPVYTSGAASRNPYHTTAIVYVAGSTATAINGVATGLGVGPFTVPAGGTITPTGAGSWTWFGLGG